MKNAPDGLNQFYIVGRKSLVRDFKSGIAYANFVAHRFHYLNVTSLGAVSVNRAWECGQATCFSFNVAAFLDMADKTMRCELVPGDRYNNSDKFTVSTIFDHHSIKLALSCGSFVN